MLWQTRQLGNMKKLVWLLKNLLTRASLEEVIFTKGTTEGINLVASTFGRQEVKAGDEIIISAMEHHSNIVPWQMLCEEKGAILKVIPINDEGELLMDEFDKLLTDRTKLVAVVHVSNSLGTINPIQQIIEKAHAKNALVLIDGAQSSPHFNIDVQAMDCDFYVFSAHKVYGPTGLGVLYGKKDILNSMPPYLGGGEMIKDVSFEKTTYNDLPYKFEAGTPNIGDTIAMRAGLDYVNEVGRDNIAKHEQELLKYGEERLKEVEGLTIVGRAKEKIGVISFIIEGVHHYDLGLLLDANGVAIRTGHHCTQPLMKRFGIDGTARASFAMYNTKEEVDVFVEAVKKAVAMLK